MDHVAILFAPYFEGPKKGGFTQPSCFAPHLGTLRQLGLCIHVDCFPFWGLLVRQGLCGHIHCSPLRGSRTSKTYIAILIALLFWDPDNMKVVEPQ